MTTIPSLGITGVEAIHYYVHDLERMRRFLTERLDFAEIGRSSAAMEARGNQKAAVFRAGEVTLVVSQPTAEGGRAWRWLNRHPEGVGTIIFQVTDLEAAYTRLDERGGTFITGIETFDVDGGTLKMFNITTPFGDTTFRFVERHGTDALFPGYERLPQPKGGRNRFGLAGVDHITSNFQTMRPMLLWMEAVMGFEVYWDVEFHTQDVGGENATSGSGLKSVVVWDEGSGVKFANNEPKRPHFRKSQINLFGEDHRGDGVQHIALVVDDIVNAVRTLRENGVEFMPTPNSYYDALPARIERLGIHRIDEDIEVLRELQILVDGDDDHSYLLQIFLKEQAGLFKDPKAGPFFIELIQRKGDNGFGAGNFRALFESIERSQTSEGR